MKNLVLCIALITLYTCNVKSQNNEYTSSDQRNTLIRLHFLVPGLLVEQRIGKNTSLVADLATGVAYYSQTYNGETESDIIFSPYFKIEPRHYFNQNARILKGKRIDYYSGQYVGLQVLFGISTKQVDAGQSIGPVWGFQRTLGRKGYWNINIGYGVYLYDSKTNFGSIGDIGIGIILN